LDSPGGKKDFQSKKKTAPGKTSKRGAFEEARKSRKNKTFCTEKRPLALRRIVVSAKGRGKKGEETYKGYELSCPMRGQKRGGTKRRHLGKTVMAK